MKGSNTRCLKITENVSFYNIASEASYGFTFWAWKNNKLPKNQFGVRVFLKKMKLTVEQCYTTGQKLIENGIIETFKWDTLGDFQTTCNT